MIAEESVYTALKQVFDPELYINVVDLGLIYEVNVAEQGERCDLSVKMTMTSPACPAGPELVRDVQEVLKNLDGVGAVKVEVVLDPPWSPDRMTEEARDELGMF
jgi:metal-sulfur cluster biosynthetic enzyme